MIAETTFSLVAETPGHAVGRTCGSLLLPLIFLALTWRAARIMRRPSVNTRCGLALALACFSWLLVLSLSAINPQRIAALAFLSFALGVIGSITSIILAIIGLSELASRRGEKIQGRARAIWAIVIAALQLALFGGSMIVGLLSSLSSTSNEPDRIDHTPGEPITFEQFNCEVTPTERWVRIKPETINPDATLVLVRIRPSIYFQLVAERIGADSGIDSQGLAELSTANIASVGELLQAGEWQEQAADGISGLAATHVARVEGQRIIYRYWVAARGGFSYQMLAWADSRQSNAETVERESRGIFRSFRQLDPELVAQSLDKPAPSRLESSQFGYALNLTGRWSAWGNVHEEITGAEFGVWGPNRSMVVIPVRLLDTECSPHAIARALHNEPLGMDVSKLSAQRGTHAGLLSLAYAYDQVFRDELKYDIRSRVLIADREAYLVAAWTPAGKTPSDEVDRWLDGFELKPEHEPPELDQLAARDRAWHATFYSYVGAELHGDSLARAIEFHNAAVALQPDNADRQRWLLIALVHANRYADTIRASEQALVHHPGHLEIRSFRAYANAHIGKKSDAIQEFSELFRAGYRDVDDLSLCTRLLGELNRLGEAIVLVQTVLENFSATNVRILLADLHAQNGDRALALEQLEAERAAKPYDTTIEWALLRHSNDSGQYRASRDIATKMIELGHDLTDAYRAKANTEFRLGWYRRAKDTLIAGAKDANVDEAKLERLLGAVNSRLGEGSNRALRQPIEPVKDSSALLSPREVDPDDFDGQQAIYLMQCRALHFDAEDGLRNTYRAIVKPLTPSGVARFSTFSFAFDPLAQRAFVNEVTVRDAAGEIVAQGKVSDYYLIDDSASGQATHNQRIQVPVPGLSVGHTVSITLTTTENGTTENMRFFEAPLGTGYPTLSSSIVLSGDTDKVHRVATPGLEPRTDGSSLIWSIERPFAGTTEPLQRGRIPRSPTVWFGSRARTWTEEAQRYLTRIEDRIRPDERARARGKNLAEPLSAAEQQALLLARFVRDQTSYQAIEFGSRGRVPNTASDTLEKRYGDCKDQSLLLQQLLTGAGIQAHLALVDTRDALVPELPSLDQFNHMIVYCPTIDGGRFFDCTDEWLNLAVTVPLGLAGQSALVLDGEDSRFVEIPGYPLEAARVASRRRIALAADRSATIRETIRFHGYYASWLRSQLARRDKDARRLWLQRQYQSIHPASILTDFAIDDLENCAKPLVIHAELRDPALLADFGGRLSGKVPPGWERFYFALEHVEQRRTDFQIRYPLQFETEIEVDAPPGTRFEANATDRPDKRESPFGSLSHKLSTERTRLRFESRATRNAGTFDAADYAAATAFSDDVLATIEFAFALESNR